MTVLVTGCFGFLGHQTCKQLLEAGHVVYGIDKVREAISLKTERINDLKKYPQFTSADINLANWADTELHFQRAKPETVVHYAGQYSVPHSTKHLHQYVEANLVGMANALEASRVSGASRFVYASSTFVQDGRLPHVMYGATKQCGELLAHVYAHEHNLGIVCLRFASTYGPMVRPDIGIFQIARKLEAGLPIDVSQGGFNYKVAFVYSEDAVECVIRSLTVPLELRYNVQTVVARDFMADLNDALTCLENTSGLSAKRVGELAPRQGFQIPEEKCQKLEEFLGYCPQTILSEGIAKFWEWFKNRNR